MKNEASGAPQHKRKGKRSKRDDASLQQNFPVVGIGASAGGLEAFEKFFAHLSADTGMAFIVVQHLDPKDGGLLPSLLTRYTQMHVIEAKDGMAIEPNMVYVIPANRDLSIEHGALSVQEPRTQRGIRMPIDFFFRRLAETQGDHAYGVILSGTGTDGNVHLAFDTCDVCGPKGYKQSGNDVVCNNCGKHFAINTIGTANVSGGCSPSHLPMSISGDSVVIKTSDLTTKESAFKT
ncbi:MAG: Fe-S-containing protein [Halobacteriota archaeon]